jgi:small-conductance mechanosensitive channel
VTILIASSAALFVGIGLGLQDIFKDIISSFFLLFERSVVVGDVVEMEGIVGCVQEINIRTSKIKTRNDITIIVPNSQLLRDKVINWSEENPRTRFIINVGVAYGSDTALVERLLVEAAMEHERVHKNPKPFVRFTDFGNSVLSFELLFWSNNIWEIEVVKSDLRFSIDQKFRESGVHIPFPQRDLHLKSGWPTEKPES